MIRFYFISCFLQILVKPVVSLLRTGAPLAPMARQYPVDGKIYKRDCPQHYPYWPFSKQPCRVLVPQAVGEAAGALRGVPLRLRARELDRVVRLESHVSS